VKNNNEAAQKVMVESSDSYIIIHYSRKRARIERSNCKYTCNCRCNAEHLWGTFSNTWDMNKITEKRIEVSKGNNFLTVIIESIQMKSKINNYLYLLYFVPITTYSRFFGGCLSGTPSENFLRAKQISSQSLIYSIKRLM